MNPPSHLRCEYLNSPLGVDERAPRLSWQLNSDRRGARQTAYRILVASTLDKLLRGEADRWDSGVVQSAQTAHVAYAGPPLRSRDLCYWTVEVWDERDAAVRSEPAFWSMGLLERSDWQARWIAADPEIVRRDPEAVASTLTDCGTPAVFRKAFEVGAPVARATVYATARGVFELRFDGHRLGDDLFAPEWTDYDKRIHYRTYDVTALIRHGRNTVAATLGDGWWSGYVGWQETRGRYGSLENSLCAQLEIEFVDGTRTVIGTDASWQCNTGPILSSDFQMGEVYDARREVEDSQGPGTKDQGRGTIDQDTHPLSEGSLVSGPLSVVPLAWLPVREVAAPSAALVAQRSEPVKITETIRPVSVVEHRPGVFIFDLGQNISGFVRLRLRGVAAGTRVTIRHGERLNPDGSLYTENLRRAKATDVYIARGGASQSGAGHPLAQRRSKSSIASFAAAHEADEVWQPHFTFHGFQYVEITGLTAADLATVTGCVVHSATAPAGRFECSHAGVNRLWLNGVWSQRDNFLSVPTDCPQRDERLGWMGDAQVFLRTASYNMDVAAFFTKWMIDVEDAQTADGIFPDVAPRVREHIRFVGLDRLCGAAGWADAGVIVPWTIWRVYGDRRIVERHWSAMVAWVDWIESKNPRGIRENVLGNNYGDWLCIPTDTTFRTHSPMKTLLATAYWADDAAKLARMAKELGREADAQRFRAMAERVKAAFQQEYVRPDGRLAVETQTAYLLALAFDLLPEPLRASAAEHLVENIRALDWHLSTGFIGISHLNPTLTLAGRADVAYRLLLQDSFPSWLYPVKHGATTIWERWNGWTHEDGFFNPHMNSFNHYSLGSIGEWLFRHVAGIELDPEVAGFDRFVLRPFVRKGLDFARGSYRTAHGEITSEWRRLSDQLEWKVRVPPNTTARAYIPSEPNTTVDTDGAKIVGRDAEFAIVELGSGSYSFASMWRA